MSRPTRIHTHSCSAFLGGRSYRDKVVVIVALLSCLATLHYILSSSKGGGIGSDGLVDDVRLANQAETLRSDPTVAPVAPTAVPVSPTTPPVEAITTTSPPLDTSSSTSCNKNSPCPTLAGSNINSASLLLDSVVQARDNMISLLQSDQQYGPTYFSQLFQSTLKNGTVVSRGRQAVVSAHEEENISIPRFQRKLQMKLLQVLIQTAKDETTCHCPRFVWSTGGHSAAAGHGNLHNESYTAYLTHAVSDVFAAVGIDFEGRNFAMGGTPSGPEVAMCSESIFGTDADVITWDFGMMEGGAYYCKLHYAQRVGINPNRPAIIDINNSGRRFRPRREQLRAVEEQGLTALYLADNHVGEMRNAIPDMFGMTTAEIEAVPPFVRHYKCNKQIEKGDPTCSAEKYTTGVCQNRKGRAGWHPGWRDHALYGNILALFLADMLVEATQDLVASLDDTPEVLLAKLQAEEDSDYETFHKWNITDAIPVHPSEPDFDELVAAVNASVLFRGPSYCHTARLPSQIRYRGILTDDDATGIDGYDSGLSQRQAEEIHPDMKVMPLTFDEGEHRVECEIPTKMDYKDYFYNKKGHGWRSLTVPNEAERKEYGRNGSVRLHGVVVVCFGACPWGRCLPSYFKHEAVYDGSLKMQLNGQPVVNVTKWADCAFLRGEQGYFWNANEAGQFELQTLVDGDDEKAFTRLSAMIVI